MLEASFQPHKLVFKQPGGTSRGVLTTKMSWYIQVWNVDNPEIKGLGECSVLPFLSPDDNPELEDKLMWCCHHINDILPNYHHVLKDWPAIRFAIETAFTDLKNGGKQILFPSDFTRGKQSIPINGLIWMGPIDEMVRRVEEKLMEGFSCLKLKIGALDLKNELSLLKNLRQRFSPSQLELRVDANGAFLPENALLILDELAALEVHSIEQPIKSGQWDDMAALCEKTPIPIALDEELIGIHDEFLRRQMLNSLKPQYIILKPSLTGGFASSQNWIDLANELNIGWWVTSALEGNIGLNAIAQWTATLNNTMPQGLGTGQVFTNNVMSPLMVDKGFLHYKFDETCSHQYFRIE